MTKNLTMGDQVFFHFDDVEAVRETCGMKKNMLADTVLHWMENLQFICFS
ncbi:hypothetical protein [Brevibacillus agri]|nr:hypothetical protein [Brevibacillus agri]MED4570690.1 hypothetical protein [Brevibacillus agri]WHX30679.1 hypothetical protein QNK09_27180 [Brevibacillus agri]